MESVSISRGTLFLPHIASTGEKVAVAASAVATFASYNEGLTKDFFGAPKAIDAQTQINHAVACAQAMQDGLVELNRNWKEKDYPEFMMRVGIHHGAGIVGNFGGPQRSDYTVIGPTVNMAARVESTAEPGAIFVTMAVREFLQGKSWEFAGEFELKGVSGKVKLYRVLNEEKKVA